MTEYKNTMLISPNTIKNMALVNLNVDDTVLAASIRVAQNIYVRDIIGTNLINTLQELVYNKIKGLEPSIDDEDKAQYKELLDDYLKDLLAYKTVAECCRRISYKIRNVGVAQNSDTNINASDLTAIKELKAEYETYFNDAANRLIDFLNANKGAFPEVEGGCVCGNTLPNLNAKYGNCGLFLG